MSDSTIDRTVLPIRRPPFGGQTKKTLEGSEPDWNQAAHVEPPAGAPNVLLVLIDDAGFGNPSTFGGPIETPNYTRMAEGGLRYNRFHVTAVCSPTRAALLTGRNQHRVGFGLVAEFSGPFPGYNATIPRDCATLPRTLQENGYMTAALGKWHLTPDNQQGSGGPFDRWPTGLGFDYFWGFLGGEAGQFDPLITENQRTIGVPEGKDGRAVLLPGRPVGEDDRLAPSRARREAGDAVVRLLRDGLQPRPAPRPAGSGPTSTRGSSTTAGTSCARRRSRARRSSASFRPTPSCRRATTVSRRGTRCPRRSGVSTPGRWRPMPATRRTRTGTWAAFSTRSRRWASSTTRS